MKLTKFGQSCILIETKKKRILVDPGYLELDKDIQINYWKDIDVILITHKHGDHYDKEAVKKILENKKTKIYTSKESAEFQSEIKSNIVKQGDKIKLGEITIDVVKAVHGYLPYLEGEKEINENIGFMINDRDKTAYITSDTICFKNDYKCDIVIVPVSGHGLVMGPYEAALFAKETEAKLVIPTHYDNPKFPVNLEDLKIQFEKQDLNYKILEIKESIEF